MGWLGLIIIVLPEVFIYLFVKRQLKLKNLTNSGPLHVCLSVLATIVIMFLRYVIWNEKSNMLQIISQTWQLTDSAY